MEVRKFAVEFRRAKCEKKELLMFTFVKRFLYRRFMAGEKIEDHFYDNLFDTAWLGLPRLF